ncbi:Aminoacylase-1 [Smittium mucronatum]|uniref:Aminoacylase-1 n=1 Tax=Smittium mucronatum TaxID=133383 RepID=A0A1R0H7D2_9FUNG|nr:Aminoacylase-1 [Smittium mucronatum]
MTVPEPESVSRFRDFLRINTMHPKPDYESSTKFLVNQAKEIGLECRVLELVKGKQIVIMKLGGSDPTLKSILLNCHTDVVPDSWKYPPFSAEREETENGDYKIYARGSQDMKVTCSTYLEALRLIKAQNLKLKRSVYAVFAPDEEIGGKDGTKLFVETPEFSDMNVGFDLDEGRVSVGNINSFQYAERTISQVKFTAHGNTGHGSQFIEGTAIEKLLPIINNLMKKRQEEFEKYKKLEENGLNMRIGEVTSINLTGLSGGKQANVVPEQFSVTFDIRVTPNIDLEEFRNYLRGLASSNGVDIELLRPDEKRSMTPVDKSNKFIAAFYDVINSRNIKVMPIISPGATDARHVRTKGVPAFGFNPIRNHEYLAHAHNEYILESSYLYGIDVYFDMIQKLANVTE